MDIKGGESKLKIVCKIKGFEITKEGRRGRLVIKRERNKDLNIDRILDLGGYNYNHYDYFNKNMGKNRI